MRLLTGPPGSGKTTRVLREMREALGVNPAGVCLLVPTATMAEHVRNSLAREGFLLRSDSVSTLGGFLERYSGGVREAPPGGLPVVVEEVLREEEITGFRNPLAAVIDELSSQGVPATAVSPTIGRVYAAAEARLGERGMALRGKRIPLQAKELARKGRGRFQTIFLDGFFTFTGPELEVLEVLQPQIVTLPDWAGARGARARLVAAGYQEERCNPLRKKPVTKILVASTPQREAEEIARRILEETAKGRRFREIGAIVRGREGAALLTATFERFGIPARSYFPQPLSSDVSVRYVVSQIEAMRSGWEEENVLRMARLGRFDWPLPVDLERFRHLEEWRHQTRAASEWAALLGVLESPFFDAKTCTFEVFWRDFRVFLEHTNRFPEDRRRDVVQVMDVYEARQWELPVVFVSGVIEGEFPRYWSEDPMLPDRERVALQRLGYWVRTTADRQEEEEFLISLAMSRATDFLFLSYSRFNAKGDERLPAFWLGEVGAERKSVEAIRPQPLRSRTVTARAKLKGLGAGELRLSPTAVETYLQCPFQYFGRNALRLEGAPLPAGERFTFLVQGNIVHEVLEAMEGSPLFVEELLQQALERACREQKIPLTYRTEAIRLEILENLTRFWQEGNLPKSETEKIEGKFKFELEPGLVVTGRIDRVLRVPTGERLVLDYKYSVPNRIRARVKGKDAGNLVQGGIYMMAAERILASQRVAGMLYYGLKKEIRIEGWHLPLAGWEAVGEAVSPDRLVEIKNEARGKVLETARQIREGVVHPDPADLGKCEYCEFRDACRVEEGAVVGARG